MLEFRGNKIGVGKEIQYVTWVDDGAFDAIGAIIRRLKFFVTSRASFQATGKHFSSQPQASSIPITCCFSILIASKVAWATGRRLGLVMLVKEHPRELMISTLYLQGLLRVLHWTPTPPAPITPPAHWRAACMLAGVETSQVEPTASQIKGNLPRMLPPTASSPGAASTEFRSQHRSAAPSSASTHTHTHMAAGETPFGLLALNQPVSKAKCDASDASDTFADPIALPPVVVQPAPTIAQLIIAQPTPIVAQPAPPIAQPVQPAPPSASLRLRLRLRLTLPLLRACVSRIADISLDCMYTYIYVSIQQMKDISEAPAPDTEAP
ncbi:hypothetical protein B0H12DRAFT_1069108 [Mycena haematopus]|nr:hypothetical protein B0H12DRAFT_1072820 [Mycena haematopus]KAJ7262643.1 hypothetical protein B0H12DRAFT_1069108 [Mycena haematopus]